MTDPRKDLDAAMEALDQCDAAADADDPFITPICENAMKLCTTLVRDHGDYFRKMLDGEPVATVMLDYLTGETVIVGFDSTPLPNGTKLYAAPPGSREPCKTHVPGFEIDMHGTIGCLRCGMPLPAPPEVE